MRVFSPSLCAREPGRKPLDACRVHTYLPFFNPCWRRAASLLLAPPSLPALEHRKFRIATSVSREKVGCRVEVLVSFRKLAFHGFWTFVKNRFNSIRLLKDLFLLFSWFDSYIDREKFGRDFEIFRLICSLKIIGQY